MPPTLYEKKNQSQEYSWSMLVPEQSSTHALPVGVLRLLVRIRHCQPLHVARPAKGGCHESTWRGG